MWHKWTFARPRMVLSWCSKDKVQAATKTGLEKHIEQPYLMGSALLSSKVTVTEETMGVSVHTGAPVGMWNMWGIFAFSSTSD